MVSMINLAPGRYTCTPSHRKSRSVAIDSSAHHAAGPETNSTPAVAAAKPESRSFR